MQTTIQLSNGQSKTYSEPVSFALALKEINPAAYGRALAVVANGAVSDLSLPAAASDKYLLEIIDFDSQTGKKIFWHSTAHLMAAAVKRLYPQTLVTIGPAIQEGFYYDFDRSEPFTPEELAAIEKTMQEIVAEKIPFKREEVDKSSARDMFTKAGEFYKLELLDSIADEKVSLYRLGDFMDLCRGPHVPHSGFLKAFKLLSIAGAYWRGDERNKMLQRIYGISFEKKALLDEYLIRQEEARKRDHRKLGKELDLFSLHEDAGAGLVYWHPKGALIRKIMEDFWRDQHLKNGYDLIFSPHIGKAHLWETSGHLSFYKDSMYSPMAIDQFDYYLKPMNCPFHIKIYQTTRRSYRQLPLRWAELGTVYRYEKSGVLHGLFRVRGFTQDDAHIFCTRSQLNEEIARVLNFVLFVLRTFGFSAFEVYLSTRPPKDTVGSPEIWDEATHALREALDRSGLPYGVDEGGGAFYGPKIDIKIKDSLQRTWQCSTIQVDFNEPERFGMTYIGEDGAEHRPIMIHRALMGSLERFFGILIEHFGGAFPVWLAPVQARILTINDKHLEYAGELQAHLVGRGFRVELDSRGEKINSKIRDAQLLKIPYMIVVGDAEVQGKTLAVRQRNGEKLPPLSWEEFETRLVLESKPPC